MSYRLIDHTADLGIEVHAPDGPRLFAQSAGAMFELICDSGSRSEIHLSQIQAAGMDWPDLMVNWLRELLYLWTGRQRLVRPITILNFTPYEITAKIGWQTYDPRRHIIQHEIKAVTYHQIAAGPLADGTQGWEAQIIFDV